MSWLTNTIGSLFSSGTSLVYRALIVVTFILGILVVGMKMEISKKDKTILELQHQNEKMDLDIRDYRNQITYTKESCERKVEVIEIERKIEDQVDQTFEEEKDTYEILASEDNSKENNTSNVCGCKYDGIGWVFK